jgi:hypothetical protein
MKDIIEVRRLGLLFLTLLIAIFLPVSAFATEVPTSTAPSAESLLVLLIGTVGAAAVTLVTAGVKRLLPNIPRAALPLVVAALGVTAEWVGAVSTGGNFSPIVAALIATGAIYLNETWTTVRDHGLTKPIADPDDPFARR